MHAAFGGGNPKALSVQVPNDHMSYYLNCSKGDYMGDYEGD